MFTSQCVICLVTKINLLNVQIIFYSGIMSLTLSSGLLLQAVIDLSVTMETGCSIVPCLVVFDSPFVMH
jgi:hypothetical protein